MLEKLGRLNRLDRNKRKRAIFCGLVMIGFIAYIIFKLVDIQIINFEEYQQKALRQQTRDTTITPKRGTIYDTNMRVLATNANVERIFISPAEIKSDEDAVLIARGLSEILGVDYDDILLQIEKKKNKQDVTIKRNVERSLANEVRQFIADNDNIKGIYFAQETKRYYPYNNLASHVIGFTGTDNEGLFGIEYKYNNYLKGVSGKIITAKNGVNQSMPFYYESYIDAQNGANLVLTIDWSIQYFLEKNLEAALIESQAKSRVTGIVMDVNTGAILAMATKPDFDLNNPYQLDDYSLQLLESLIFETADEKSAKKVELQYTMWRNKAITEPYEPGSTFKVITAAMGLEESLVKPDEHFYCPGYKTVGGFDIGCHVTWGHGSLTFAEGIQKSCNPVFMTLAERIGAPLFHKYMTAFGYKEKTGIDLPGEAGSIMHDLSIVKELELATESFGQTFKVTPIQQITGIATVANGGNLVTPYIVKAIVDDNGNVIKSFEPNIKRNVVSKETTKTLASIMAEGVANGGSSRNAFVKGYSVAAKTGTSQKRDIADETARIGSCVAFAPADDPQVAVIFIVDEPTVGSVYGGMIAAPYVSKILAETLPYLGIEPKYTDDELAEMEITVSNYIGYETNKAVSEITLKGLVGKVEGNGSYIIDQIPKAGNTLPKGGSIILYTDNASTQTYVTVPDVINLTAAQANKKIVDAGLNISIEGAENMQSDAPAVRQSPEAGTSVPLGTIITVEFRYYDNVH